MIIDMCSLKLFDTFPGKCSMVGELVQFTTYFQHLQYGKHVQMNNIVLKNWSLTSINTLDRTFYFNQVIQLEEICTTLENVSWCVGKKLASDWAIYLAICVVIRINLFLYICPYLEKRKQQHTVISFCNWKLYFSHSNQKHIKISIQIKLFLNT